MASIKETVSDTTFGADGRVLVVAIVKGADHEIVFFDLAHPDQTPRRCGGKLVVFSLAVSPDGGLVAASTGGGLVRLFDTIKGELIESLHGHLTAVFGLNFSADGRRLISEGGPREAIKLWDVGTRQELLTLAGTGSVLRLAQMDCRWRRDPRRSAVAGLAGTVLGGNRRGGGEGDQRGSAAVNATARDWPLPRDPGERLIGDPHGPSPTSDVQDDPVGGRDRFRLELVLLGPPAFGQRHVLEQTDKVRTGLAGVSRQEHAACGSVIGNRVNFHIFLDHVGDLIRDVAR